MGNLHSCLKAISRYTSNYKLITNPEEMSGAEGVVLPGDGAFDRAMINLQEQNFIRPLKEYLQNGGKLFGICIGFQLLFQDSDEDLSGKGQIIEGLGFVPGSIRRFRDKAFKVPHMGWNEIFLDNCESVQPKRNLGILQAVEHACNRQTDQRQLNSGCFQMIFVQFGIPF